MTPTPLAFAGSGMNTVKLGSETLRSTSVSGPKMAGLGKVISDPTPGRLLGGSSGQSRITGFSETCPPALISISVSSAMTAPVSR
jgi:hypothetical protein